MPANLVPFSIVAMTFLYRILNVGLFYSAILKSCLEVECIWLASTRPNLEKSEEDVNVALYKRKKKHRNQIDRISSSYISRNAAS